MHFDYRKLTYVVVLIVAGVALFIYTANEDEVKFCENPRTGDIVTVRTEYPCPAGTIEVR